MKIVNEAQKKLVTPAQMQDGEIGVIRKWDVTPSAYIGRIVQRFENRLIALGQNKDRSFLNADKITVDECLIEILPPGTLLEI